MAAEIAGIKPIRSHDLSAPQGVRGRNSDNTLIQARLGWEPSFPLRHGLELTYRWIYDSIASPHCDAAASGAVTAVAG